MDNKKESATMPKTAEPSAAEIKKLRNQDPPMSWNAIGDKLKISPAQAMLMHEQADGANKISGTDAQIGKQIVKARKEGLSWGIIMGRSGLGLQRVKTLFTEASGQDPSDSSIGKGGRTPGGIPAKKVAKAVKKTAKKTAVKKAVKKAPAAKKAVAKKAAKKAPAKKSSKNSESA